MHDIWNPWHGCRKVSEGCRHCYMYMMDRQRGLEPSVVRCSKGSFDYPIQRAKHGGYRIRSGEMIRVCMNSDFFVEEADAWRHEAWRIMRERSDVKFFLLTRRIQRVRECLPPDWGGGWDNIFLNVSCENQARAELDIPILLGLPFTHKGIMTAPLIGPIDLEPWLVSREIEQVIAGGENYGGARLCRFDWIKAIRAACEKYEVSFCFIETGTHFEKDGRSYRLPSKWLQSEMAWKSGISYTGRPMRFRLHDRLGLELIEEELHRARFGKRCLRCGSRPICNGADANGDCT